MTASLWLSWVCRSLNWNLVIYGNDLNGGYWLMNWHVGSDFISVHVHLKQPTLTVSMHSLNNQSHSSIQTHVLIVDQDCWHVECIYMYKHNHDIAEKQKKTKHIYVSCSSSSFWDHTPCIVIAVNQSNSSRVGSFCLFALSLSLSRCSKRYFYQYF